MVQLTTFLYLSALIILSSAKESDDAVKKQLGLTKVPAKAKVEPRSLRERCQGTCVECFGDGYILCPGSDFNCYLPGDVDYGLTSCPSSSSSDYTSSYTSSAPQSTFTGSQSISDFCNEAGATCQSCFGEGYISCPDNLYCYNPNDPEYDTCPSDGGTATATSAGTTGTELSTSGGASAFEMELGKVVTVVMGLFGAGMLLR